MRGKADFKRFNRMNFCTLCTIFMAFGPGTSQFTLLTIAPFVGIRQKSTYHAKYLRISWTYLDLLYRRISGNDYPNIRLAVVQGTLLWQPVKRRVERPLLFASAFDNGLADRKSAFRRFSGNNQATSWLNLVNFRRTVLKFLLLKRVIFASILPQFDDDFHSSRYRSKTERKITILISAE